MRSMTGFGAGAADGAGARITVEIRGVNQRHLDVRIAAPREYAAWEGDLRDRVRARAERGRIDVTVVRQAVAGRRRYHVAVRQELAVAYVEAARALGRRLRLPGEVALVDVLRLPDLFEVAERPPDLRRELPVVHRALAAALAAFTRERDREGRHLQRDMRGRVATLRGLVRRIRTRVPVIQEASRQRLQNRVSRLVAGMEMDAARVVQEIGTLVERGDVTEELVRLDSHLGALGAAVKEAGPAGKRIEFLLQEVLRELNTTGAKTADAGINGWVLAGKAEVEKLREQVQNVE